MFTKIIESLGTGGVLFLLTIGVLALYGALCLIKGVIGWARRRHVKRQEELLHAPKTPEEMKKEVKRLQPLLKELAVKELKRQDNLPGIVKFLAGVRITLVNLVSLAFIGLSLALIPMVFGGWRPSLMAPEWKWFIDHPALAVGAAAFIFGMASLAISKIVQFSSLPLVKQLDVERRGRLRWLYAIWRYGLGDLPILSIPPLYLDLFQANAWAVSLRDWNLLYPFKHAIDSVKNLLLSIMQAPSGGGFYVIKQAFLFFTLPGDYVRTERLLQKYKLTLDSLKQEYWYQKLPDRLYLWGVPGLVIVSLLGFGSIYGVMRAGFASAPTLTPEETATVQVLKLLVGVLSGVVFAWLSTLVVWCARVGLPRSRREWVQMERLAVVIIGSSMPGNLNFFMGGIVVAWYGHGQTQVIQDLMTILAQQVYGNWIAGQVTVLIQAIFTGGRHTTSKIKLALENMAEQHAQAYGIRVDVPGPMLSLQVVQALQDPQQHMFVDEQHWANALFLLPGQRNALVYEVVNNKRLSFDEEQMATQALINQLRYEAMMKKRDAKLKRMEALSQVADLVLPWRAV